MKKPLILITNDDGIDSPGIYALAKEMKNFAEVIVVAPDRQQSAVSSALTFTSPLRVKEFRSNGTVFGYSINGTPADCVKLACSTLLERKPDIVLSGINHGQNTAINVMYSGTVSGAIEGMLLGIPSIAVSLCSYDLSFDCSITAKITREVIEKYIDKIMPGTFYNINVPAISKDELKGIKVTKLSQNLWDDAYEKRKDPFHRDYYWFSGNFGTGDFDPNTDDIAVKEGYASLTPIKIQFNDNELYEILKQESDV